jgi:hypothetical protein
MVWSPRYRHTSQECTLDHPFFSMPEDAITR